jgi:hypothetical protein
VWIGVFLFFFFYKLFCPTGALNKFTPREKGVDQRLDGQMTFKRTYERLGLKDGGGKLRIETSGGE